MDKLRIKGGHRLEGQVRISGAKNSALPAMAACLLTPDEVVLENIPLVNDIFTTRRLVRELGVAVEFEPDHSARLKAEKILSHEAPYDLVKTMRASVLVLGPLLARTGYARVSLPGGCAIGARPINLHIKGFEKLGASVRTEHGYVEAAAARLRGSEILFDKITVTGTENVMMAAALADGRSVLQNVACEGIKRNHASHYSGSDRSRNVSGDGSDYEWRTRVNRLQPEPSFQCYRKTSRDRREHRDNGSGSHEGSRQ